MSEIKKFTENENKITLVNNNYENKKAKVILQNKNNTTSNPIQLSQDEQIITLTDPVNGVINVELSIYNLKINGDYALRVETYNEDDFKLEMSMIDRDRVLINLINNIDFDIEDIVINNLNSLLDGENTFNLFDNNIIKFTDSNTIELSKDFFSETISNAKNLIKNSSNNQDENFNFRKCTKKIIRKIIRIFDSSYTIKIHPDNVFIPKNFENRVKDNFTILTSGNIINIDKQFGSFYSLLDNIGDEIIFDRGIKRNQNTTSEFNVLKITKTGETTSLVQFYTGAKREYKDGETLTFPFFGKLITILFGSVLLNISPEKLDEKLDEKLRDTLIKKNYINKNRSGNKISERKNVGTQVKYLLSLDKDQLAKKEKIQDKSAYSRLLRIKGGRTLL